MRKNTQPIGMGRTVRVKANPTWIGTIVDMDEIDPCWALVEFQTPYKFFEHCHCRTLEEATNGNR